MPKPDWAAFYPIYNFDSDRIPTSERWPWGAKEQQPPLYAIVDNLSLETLRRLAEMPKNGLQSSTSAIFLSPEKQKKYKFADLICFPWLIAEHKNGDEKSEVCYCQAANAGAAAVLMLQRLCEVLPEKLWAKDCGHIPPVVTVTTVHKTVRVWIMYMCRVPVLETPPEQDSVPRKRPGEYVSSHMHIIQTFPSELYADQFKRKCNAYGKAI